MTAIALRGVRVWDGVADAYLAGVDSVRVEGEHIAALGRSGELSAGAREVRFEGAHLIPGLIDAHVHLNIDAALKSPEEQARVPEADAYAAMRARAEAMVRAGITTARDLGGPSGREFALRDAIACGEQLGPRLLCAGQPLTTPRGHCWFWGGEVADAERGRAFIRRQVERGAEWIKVMATGGLTTRGTKAVDVQFSASELREFVLEAKRLARPVAAHCHGTQGIRNSAAAGVRSVEHCSFAGNAGFGSDFDPRVADALARAETWVSPTVNSGWARYFAPDGTDLPFARRMRGVYTGLRRAGVPLVASTDAGIPGVAHDRLPEALPIFARLAGLNPSQALRCATAGAAAALGLGERVGSVRPGRSADLLVFRGDPLRDLGALTQPLLVLAQGRIAHSADEAIAPIGGGWLAPPTATSNT